MGKFGTKNNLYGYSSDSDTSRTSKDGRVVGGHAHISDAVSELSHDDTSSISSGFSKSSAAFRAKFAPSRFGKGKKKKSKDKDKDRGRDGVVGGGNASSSNGGASGKKSPSTATTAASTAASSSARVRFEQQEKSPHQPQDSPSTASKNRSPRGKTSSKPSSHNQRQHNPTDQARLAKDAKSRYNIGLIYLKTGDYSKAQENLEHSLYCHIQLAGHDSTLYTNDSLFAIASVREKLGDCYQANTAIVDKCLALDHYEEARRLLGSVDKEDAPENVVEMLERVEEKLGGEELCRGEVRRAPSAHPLPGSRWDENRKVGGVGMGVAAATGVGLGVGIAAGGAGSSPAVAAAATTATTTTAPISGGAAAAKFHKKLGKIHKGIGNIIDSVDAAFDAGPSGVKANIHDKIHHVGNGGSSVSSEERESSNEVFNLVSVHLERDNHRTALNQLEKLLQSPNMGEATFRNQMVDYMMTIGDSAFTAKKIGVATDAYEGAFSILKQEEDTELMDGGNTLQLAIKGCVRGHKQLANEKEQEDDFQTAIDHRNRVYQLLDMNKRTVPACQQLVMIAFLHGQMDQFQESSEALSDAIRRLFRGVQSFDLMPKDRISLLIRCYHMRAICYAKQRLWTEAFEQYDEVLPLIAREEGIGSRDYNSALIHKAALLVTTGDYASAISVINQYFKNAKETNSGSRGEQIVDDVDHVMALDTRAAAHLKMGKVDEAIANFEKKLSYVETLPKNDELKSETMHKLGCLLAYRQRHDEALPLLSGALEKRKYLYDTKNKFVFESSWAVAATSHTLGKNDTALKEYGLLLEKINKIEDNPIDSVVIHNSAGKLFFEDGKTDRAIKAFKDALRGAESSKSSEKIRADISMNLANALSAKGDYDSSIKIYDKVLEMESIQRSKEYYLALYNQSLTLMKKGEVQETKMILEDIIDSTSSLARDAKGSAYLTLGNIALTEGQSNEALQYFENALSKFSEDEPSDLPSITQVKKSMAMTYLELGLHDDALSKLEEALRGLSQPGVEGKAVGLLMADVWSCMSRVHQRRGDIPAAKNYSKLALQSYKCGYGENHPITLRNVSNLAVLLLQEAEGLPKAQSKPIIDAAKFEMEDTLQKFISFNDMWTYRLDVASLKTNLAFVAVWQGKPKKARKLLRQIQEIEIPANHPLSGRIGILEQRVEKLEKSKS